MLLALASPPRQCLPVHHQSIAIFVWFCKCSISAPFWVFWAVVLYTVFGAYLFMWLEVPADLDEKRKAHEYHLVVRDTLLFKLGPGHRE